MGIEQITLNEDNTRIDFVYISPKDNRNDAKLKCKL